MHVTQLEEVMHCSDGQYKILCLNCTPLNATDTRYKGNGKVVTVLNEVPRHEDVCGVQVYLHAPASLLSGDRVPATHCIGGWAPEPVWTPWRRDKFTDTAGNRTLIVQPVAKTLY